MKRLLNAMWLPILWVVCCAPLYAADLELNGIASFTHLRKEYYVGALYVRSPMIFPAEILADNNHKRMVLRVTTDKWSPRRWALNWQDNIAINNDLSANPELIEHIMYFASFPQGNLSKGDEVVIEFRPVLGTTITLNRQEIVKSKGDTLFEYFLKTWIGELPPSKEFRSRILKRHFDEEEKALMHTFEATKLSSARRNLVSGWIKKNQQAELAAEKAEQEEKRKEDERKRLLAQAEAEKIARKKAAERAAQLKKQQEAKRKREEEKKAKLLAEKKAQEAKQKKAEKDQKSSKKAVPEPKVKTKSKAEIAAEHQYYFDLYHWELSRAIRGSITYPVWARQFSQSGTVKMAFTLDRNGQIVKINSLDESVSQMLVKEVDRAIRETALFVLPPSELTGNTWDLTFSHKFDLRSDTQDTLKKPQKPKTLAARKVDKEEYKQILGKYIEDVKTAITNFVVYPEAARVLRQRGKVEITVIVDSEGLVLDIKEKSPSRHLALNQEMQAAVERAIPLPPIPEELNKDKLEVDVEYNFKP